MTFIATPTEEQVTGQWWPIEHSGFDALLYPESLSCDSQDLISPMDGISIDNASLRNFSQGSQAQSSTFLGVNDFFSSNYVCTLPTVSTRLMKLMVFLRILVIIGSQTLIQTNAVISQTFPVSNPSMSIMTISMGIAIKGISR
jgi:hypothetical protein